ncbi:MAG: hypothetical protein SH809_02065 [Rhodothermales bacterium]|nr:hypothetical protein [Rhodothermales bacterium]
MKALPYIALIAFVVAFTPHESSAQFNLGVQGGYNADVFSEDGIGAGAYYLGGQARFGLGDAPLIISPSVHYYFTGIDDVNVMQLNADVLFPFTSAGRTAIVTPYLGVGLGISRVMLDVDAPLIGDVIESDRTDYGLNVLGGVSFGAGPVSPFVQARALFGDHLAFVNDDGEGGPGYMFSVGLLFRVGQ